MGENAENARDWVEAWNRGEIETLLTDAPADVEWVVAREHPDAKTHRGPEQIREYFRDWRRTMPDISIEVLDTVEIGDRLLQVLRLEGTGSGSGALTGVTVAFLTTFRDGQPVRVEEFLDADEGRRVLAGD